MSQTLVVYAYNSSPGLKINKKFDWLFHCVALTQVMFQSLQKYGPLASTLRQMLSPILRKGRRLKQAWITRMLQSFLKHYLPHLLFKKRLKK
jgi:hypothetical protein